MKIEQDCYIDMHNHDWRSVFAWLSDQGFTQEGLVKNRKYNFCLIYIFEGKGFFEFIRDKPTDMPKITLSINISGFTMESNWNRKQEIDSKINELIKERDLL